MDLPYISSEPCQVLFVQGLMYKAFSKRANVVFGLGWPLKRSVPKKGILSPASGKSTTAGNTGEITLQNMNLLLYLKESVLAVGTYSCS